MAKCGHLDFLCLSGLPQAIPLFAGALPVDHQAILERVLLLVFNAHFTRLRAKRPTSRKFARLFAYLGVSAQTFNQWNEAHG
ncbi:MAG: hypothetical protein VX181_15460, partial [Pseudomonadota bacterium]|nr:hypothetical protein [Pseudomonadota bacterium]